MMRLRWTRTVLCALGFVWVMGAWHLRERRQLADRAQALELIGRVCATERDRFDCELDFRLRLLGGGTRVSGTVDVSGSVDVSQ
jgi:hypothetical protein